MHAHYKPIFKSILQSYEFICVLHYTIHLDNLASINFWDYK